MNLSLDTHGFVQRAIAYFAALRAWFKRSLVQRILFLIAALVFSAGIAVSYSIRPKLFSALDIDHIVFLSFVLAPLLVIASSITFQVTCRIVGIPIRFVEAVKISVLSSAANYLPLPGGPALRIAAMMDRGATLKKSTIANIATALVWFGTTFLHASIWAGLINSPVWIILALLGFLCLISGIIFIRRINQRILDIVLLVLVSIGATLTYAFGFWVSLVTLGFGGSFGQAVVISVAGVIGAAVSIVPSGLGIRELAAASIALWVAIDPTIGFMASAVLHLTTIVPLIVMALFFSVSVRPSRIE